MMGWFAIKNRCKHCDRILKSKNLYCDIKCRTRYNANQQYLRRRNDEDYKKEAYKRLKRWVKENRERSNEYMKAYMKRKIGDKTISQIYYRKNRERMKERRRIQNKASYERNKHKHIERNREYQRKYRARLKLLQNLEAFSEP